MLILYIYFILKFLGYVHNESKEFLRIYFEDLKVELNEVKTKSNYKELNYDFYKTKQEIELAFINFSIIGI